MKFFSRPDGYGFLTTETETDGEDILLPSNVLQSFGAGSVAEDACLQVRVTRQSAGWLVREIVSWEPAVDRKQLQGFARSVNISEPITHLPIRPARVKWFDSCRGYGFVNCFAEAQDLFLHQRVLLGSGFKDAVAGEALAVRAARGKRGLMVVQVLPWSLAPTAQYPLDAH